MYHRLPNRDVPGLVILLIGALFFLGSPGHSRAATTTWQSGSEGYWTNAANWSAGVPGPLDDAAFDNSGSGNAVIDGDVFVNDLIITNGYTGSLTFQQGVAAELTVSNDFFLVSGASIVCTYSSTSGNGTGRTIRVEGNATVNGTLDADGKGFPQKQGPGYTGAVGAHGGTTERGGSVYGSLTSPTALGSGSYNGDGGGAIKLDVTGTLTLNGEVTADGLLNNHGPAGGSIWLIADLFSGSGIVSADAKQTGNTYGGGGGRVAILYNNSTFSGSVSVAGGYGTSSDGQPGTLWEPGRFPASGDLVIDTSYQYYRAGSQTNHWNVTVSNAWLEFQGGSLILTNLVLLDGATVRFDRELGGTDDFGLSNLAVCGSIVVSNSTLGLPAEGDYALAGDLVVDASSTLYAFGNTTASNGPSGGTPGDPHGIGVTITAAGNALIDGLVDASAIGFPSKNGPGFDGVSGAHGGYGSRLGGPGPYGVREEPTALGSGGYNASGGGAIRIAVTNTLTVNGTINADSGSNNHAGSGGSIWLQADTFAGTGDIHANALHGSSYGGSGGRIALIYSTKTFTGTRTAEGSGTPPDNVGEPGTIYEPIGFPATGDVTVAQSGHWDLDGGTYNWNLLTVSNGATAWFENGTVTITNLLVIEGATLKLTGGTFVLVNDVGLTNGNMHLEDTTFSFGSLVLTDSCSVVVYDSCTVAITQSLTVADHSTLTLPPGTYTFSTLAFGDDSTLYLPPQTYNLDALHVPSNSTLYPSYPIGDANAINADSGGTVGAPHGEGPTFNVSGNALIEGTVSVEGMGFPTWSGPGGSGGTAGHGGEGTYGGTPPTYGRLTRPTALGSGSYNAAGGGAVTLHVGGTLTVDGTIDARSQPVNHGSAGGSVWMTANVFAGGGLIQADSYGGTAYAGGGGRVAIEYTASTFTGSVSVAGGEEGSVPGYGPGGTGTVYTCLAPCQGFGISGCGGVTLESDFGLDFNGTKISRAITHWDRSGPHFSWTDTSTDPYGNQRDTLATYTLEGLVPNQQLNVYDNDALLFTTNSGAGGGITFAVTLDAPHTLRIPPPMGTVIMVR